MEVFYLGEAPRRLFMALHVPARPAHTGLVLCPPLWTEMNSTYAHLARWGKDLAEQGFAVLRYHPYGSGESDGNPADFTLESACADAAAALSCLRERARVKRGGFLGVRFGGSVAVHTAHAARPDFLVLWSPTVNLRQYCRELLRLRLTKELVHQRYKQVKVTTQTMIQELEAGRSVDILGYELSPEFYRQMTAKPSWPEQASVPEVLWLARSQEQGQAMPIVATWKGSGCQVDVKFFAEPVFWEEMSQFPRQLAASSRQWLGREAPHRYLLDD